MIVFESVRIAAFKKNLEVSPSDPTATQPQQRTKSQGQLPCLQKGARRECIKVTSEDVKSLLEMSDTFEQCAKIAHPATFSPVCVHCPEMNAKDSSFSTGQDYFQ